MFYLFLLIAFLLALSLVFTLFKTGKFRIWAKTFRIVIVSLSMLVFSYFFIQKSIDQFLPDSLTVQIVNKLPFPLDFYIIKVNDEKKAAVKYETRHLGSIRNNFYRNDYLKMDYSEEFWVAGYMGKRNLVYFSQHAVPNKNMDQTIETRNYIIQSSKLADIAKSNIEELKMENMKAAIWITLGFLLLFLNLTLLLRKTK